jgi:hypothetical protein
VFKTGEAAAAPPKLRADGLDRGAAAATASGALRLCSLRMFTKRELNADCASIMFSKEPPGGACGG